MAKRDIWTFRPDEELKKDVESLKDILDYDDRTEAIEDLLKEGIKHKKKKLLLSFLIFWAMLGAFIVGAPL